MQHFEFPNHQRSKRKKASSNFFLYLFAVTLLAIIPLILYLISDSQDNIVHSMQMEVRDSTGNYSTEVSYVHDSTIPALINTVNAENSNPFTPEYLQEQEHKDKVAAIYYEDYELLKTLVEFPAETYYEDFASFHFAVENVRLNLKNKVHPYSPFFLFRLTQYKCLKCGLIVKKTGYKIVETQKLCGIKGSHLREEKILSGEEAARMTKLALRRGAEAARVSR